MRIFSTRSVATFAALLIVAQPAIAADLESRSQTDSVPVIRDVELSPDRTATGRIIDQQGKPVAAIAVALHTSNGIVEGMTDEQGRFRIAGLSGGACIVQVSGVSYGCRLWIHGTAPPKALKSISVVDQTQPVVRGQNGDDDDGFSVFGGDHLESLHGLSKAQLIGLGITAGAIVGLIIAIENASD